MEYRIFQTCLIISALLAFSSGSFFLLPPRSKSVSNNQHTKENTAAAPPNYSSIFYSKSYSNTKSTGESNQSYNINSFANSRTNVREEGSPIVNINQRCVQRSSRDFRSHPYDCSQFTLCSGGTLITLSCPKGSVFHDVSKSCVAKGSYYDTCSSRNGNRLMCPRGVTHKKAHPSHCAQYYHCGMPAKERTWEEHLNECEYPLLFNDETERCEHFSMVSCGTRPEPIDPCDYKANACDGHAQCIPCSIRHPSCRGKKNGMNAWKSREGSPHYVVCAGQRVVYHGMCAQDRGVQIFDEQLGICKMLSY